MKMVFTNLDLLLACFCGSFFSICSGSIFRGRGSIGASAGNVLVLYSVNFPQKSNAAMKVRNIANPATELHSNENQFSLDQSIDSNPLFSCTVLDTDNLPFSADMPHRFSAGSRAAIRWRPRGNTRIASAAMRGSSARECADCPRICVIVRG